MNKLWWKIILVLVLVALCLWSVYPPQEKVRLGKDLRGGVSLIYHVNIDPGDSNPQGTLAQVITVLKERVNPTGVLDISMQPLGNDRIEIVMPLPNDEVQSLRVAYEQARDALLREAHISAGELQTALEAATAVERFGGRGERRQRIEDLQGAFDTHQDAADALEAARAAGADASVLAPLELAVANAAIDFERQREEVLRQSLSRARLERTLRLATVGTPLRDESNNPVIDATGNEELGPSPRDVEIERIRADFPHLADRVETLVADYDAYAAKRTGFDDPEDLMRLLRGAGVLEFHIAVKHSDPQGVNPDDLRAQLAEHGPEGTDSVIARWYPINDLKQWYDKPEQLDALEANPVGYFASPGRDLVAAARDGQYYMLLYTIDAASLTHAGGREWAVTAAFPTVDNFGRRAVGFQLDGAGGREMLRLTGPHVGEPMAIVLDDQVYSAPNINTQIGKNGIIQGTFSESELSYLIRVLAAGSLEARLTPDPIAINTLGPSIGEDNLRRGLDAFVVAVIAVAAFMMIYYFFAGLVADIALLANGVIIFGVMAMIDGTFTLPGLAGIVLTIGMAVDANVLIYERIREELFAGEVDLRGAIRLGYAKALSTILDANITNLIVCFVLFKTATTEVKGFALTLSIGICGTLFTALFLTRVIYELYTDVAHFKRLPMLPTVVPAVHRALDPNIDWIGLRKYFMVISGVGVLVSIGLVAARGVDMFDTEFRGGVSVTMLTTIVDANHDGEPDAYDDRDDPVRLMLPQTGPDGVETRVQALAGALDDPARRDEFVEALHAAGVATDEDGLEAVRAILAEMANASVLTVGTTEVVDGQVEGSSFQVKVASPKGLQQERTITDTVVAAIVDEFGGQLDVTRPLSFAGADDPGHAAYTFPIIKDILGDDIERPRYRDRVSEYLGGVAIVIDDIEPPVTTDDVAKRLSRMRSQPDFASYMGRDVGVFGLEPADPLNPAGGYRSVAVAVFDPSLSHAKVDFELWDEQVAAAEWNLVRQGLQRRTSLEQVSSFSSAVAETLSAKAIVAVTLSLLGILVYIWIRFGSLRYSAAAIVALVHDVCMALGLLALTSWIGGSVLSSWLLIEKFQIDLGVVAALLTIIGYSLNDTIVILDRIRENRGKLPIPTADIVNRSINQTISRTVLTSFTTLLAVGIMFAFGGSGIRPFAYCLLTGLVFGTYSSVAIAAPLVVRAGGAQPATAGTAAAGAERKAVKERATASSV